MCSYETYISPTYGKFYYHDKAITVASYIEHIVLVPDIICCREILSDVRKGMPFGLLGDVISTR